MIRTMYFRHSLLRVVGYAIVCVIPPYSYNMTPQPDGVFELNVEGLSGTDPCPVNPCKGRGLPHRGKFESRGIAKSG